ncbi:MAG: TlyA family RNA methyltransferase [Actinomycetia bacterium]|nr:TlyA family RNA methyltransferase [Actinomycetes bacterium]
MTRRRLDTELVRRRLVSSRTEAKQAIDAGLVRVEANASPKPSTMVSPQDTVRLVRPPQPFVSRAGRKLDAAIDAFTIDVQSKRCLDVGASTGGFTDCLLQRGAMSVVALDVGHGQLHWKIRSDERVAVIERLNIRDAEPDFVGGPFEVVVADLSFISLRTVASALDAMGEENADWLLLIKPQFEAGRHRVGKGGIVRDSGVRYDVVVDVIGCYAQRGLGCQGLIVSPIRGAAGNIEYIAWFSRASSTVDDGQIQSLIEGIDT